MGLRKDEVYESPSGQIELAALTNAVLQQLCETGWRRDLTSPLFNAWKDTILGTSSYTNVLL